MKVLVLGGYGTFGGRLVRLLAGRPQLTLLVAGRSSAKAQSFCSNIAAAAKLTPLPFDRDGDVFSQLQDAAPDMVVDASGPFQVYGDDPYAVVKACIALKIDLYRSRRQFRLCRRHRGVRRGSEAARDIRSLRGQQLTCPDRRSGAPAGAGDGANRGRERRNCAVTLC
jgi:hypothetical protein